MGQGVRAPGGWQGGRVIRLTIADKDVSCLCVEHVHVSSRRPPSNIDKGVRTVSQGGRAVVKANALGVAATCIKYFIFY